MKHSIITSVVTGALAFTVACTTLADDPSYHEGEDPWTVLEREQREGPPRYASRVHNCAKMRVATIGHLLTSRGVDLAATGEVSAGRIFTESAVALGGPKYTDRVRENLELGIATASKLFDIYVQAAPEIIANLPNRAECMKGTVPAQLFDSSNRCVASGFTCLMGIPATPEHLAICNETIKRAADIEAGKRMAVAVLAAAAHTCE
jgi:hypothetical protein